MAYQDKRLAKFAKGSDKFIKLDLGDSIKVKYISWKVVHDEKYDKEKPVYIFKTEDGKQKEMGTSSKKFAKKMMAVVPGSIIQVTKTGEGQKTDFAVKVLKEAKMTAVEPLDEDEEEIEEEEAPKKSKKAVVEDDEDEDEDEDEEEDEEEEEAPKKKKKKAKKVVEDEDEDEEEAEELF